jgi:hypothetical protein
MKKVLLELVNLLEKQSIAISGLEAHCLPKSADPTGAAQNAPSSGAIDSFAALRARIRAMPLGE